MISAKAASNIKAFEGIGKISIWIGSAFVAIVGWIALVNFRLSEVSSRAADASRSIHTLELRAATDDARFESIRESLTRIEKKLP